MFQYSVGIFQVTVKYFHQPRPNQTIYYRRGIPKPFKELFDNKPFYVRSTGTNDPKLAIKEIERINKGFEKMLQDAKRGSVSKNLVSELEKFLDDWGVNIKGQGNRDVVDVLKGVLVDKIEAHDPEVYHSEMSDTVRESLRKEALTPVEDLALQAITKGLKLKASEYLEPYLEYKGKVGNKKFTNDQTKALNDLIDLLGDRPPCEYSRYDMNRLIKRWGQGVKTATVHKRLGLIRAMFNKVNQELEIGESHPFHNWNIPNYGEDKEEREDFSMEQLKVVSSLETDDDINRIILIMMDTGLRVNEVLGLSVKELVLDVETPYISLNKNPFRRLKTKNSVRIVPLVGKAIEAVKLVADSEDWLFPRYLDREAQKFKNDSVSNVVNQRLEKLLGEDAPTAHSFRHTMATSLRNVDCPKDVREELCGWRSGVSELYGSPTDIVKKAGYLQKVASLRD